MSKRLTAFIMLFALSLTLLPGAAYAVQVKGEWVLDSIEDQEARDYDSGDDDFGYQSWIDYTYERSAFVLDWRTSWKEYNADTSSYDTYNSGGNVSARFEGIPQSMRPGESVTLTTVMSSAAVTDYPDLNADTDEGFCFAAIKFSSRAENVADSYNYFNIPSATFASSFAETQSLSFSFAEGYEGEIAWIEVSLYTPADTQMMSTTYYYRYTLTAAEVTAETPDSVELGGLVRSVENKPMAWMKLQAWIYYETEKYTGEQPDVIVDGVTDHLGRYKMTLPLREGDAEPVGILLVGTLECLYLENNATAFYFVDMADSFSRSNNITSVSTWLTVNPADYKNVTKPNEPIRMNRLLAFYHLGLDAWSFDGELMPDPVYYFSTGDQVQVLQNLSYLYTAAYDAWFFGGVTLGESAAMLANPLRIEARWTPTGDTTVSNYTAADNTIHLEAGDCKRDDNSRFTILHEFGHAFDAMSLGNGSLHAASGYQPNDTNHGGYLNGSTSDSYIEGFATCFAALVQRYNGYPNPGKLSWITLTEPSEYKAWQVFNGSEELSIASLLYYSHVLVGDTANYWGLLKPDRLNFAEYYSAIRGELSSDGVQQLDAYAYDAGLFTMPFGNGRYDPGEPFRDMPDAGGHSNGTYDPGEPYADLMYDVNPETGQIDETAPLQAFKKEELTIGTVAGAGITRATLVEPVDCNLELTGDVPEYLLIDILTEDGVTRMLRATEDGEVFLGLPYLPGGGLVTVSVPGGNAIYTGDLSELQAARDSHPGLPIPLDSVEITSDDLAPEGTLVVATYGDPNASGVLENPYISEEELSNAAQAYASDAPAGNGGNSGGNQGSGSGVVVTPEPDMDHGLLGSAFGVILVIILVIVTVVVLVIVIVALSKRGKNHRQNAPPYGVPPSTPSPYGAPPQYGKTPAAPPPQQHGGASATPPPPPYGKTPATPPPPPHGRTPAAPPPPQPGKTLAAPTAASCRPPSAPPQTAPRSAVQGSDTHIRCPSCGASTAPGNAFCVHCGKKLPDKKFCRFCGAAANLGSAFCQRCGKPMQK